MSKLSNAKLDILIDLHQEKYIESALDYNVSLAVNELKKYRDLEEKGLLVKLPCKVGDTVYEIVNDEIISFSFKKQWRIARYLEAGIFGKIAFLTKEEAEKALKEMEGAE